MATLVERGMERGRELLGDVDIPAEQRPAYDKALGTFIYWLAKPAKSEEEYNEVRAILQKLSEGSFLVASIVEGKSSEKLSPEEKKAEIDRVDKELVTLKTRLAELTSPDLIKAVETMSEILGKNSKAQTTKVWDN